MKRVPVLPFLVVPFIALCLTGGAFAREGRAIRIPLEPSPIPAERVLPFLGFWLPYEAYPFEPEERRAYLNLWVCPLECLAGVARFPGGSVRVALFDRDMDGDPISPPARGVSPRLVVGPKGKCVLESGRIVNLKS